jgi:hypothetical protein
VLFESISDGYTPIIGKKINFLGETNTMTTSGNETTEADTVMGVLKADGSLRYFFLQGGVAVCSPNGAPNPEVPCSMKTFLDLRERGLVTMTKHNVMGYPYFADNHRSDVYRAASKNTPTP